MRFIYTIVISVLMLALGSCTKELDIEYHDIEPLTVIEGELTPEGVRIGICLTTPMDEPMDRTRLTDATVNLTDLTSGMTFTLTPDADGYYTADVRGTVGHKYQLTVGREGRTYEAQTVLYPPTEILGLEFNWIKMPYDYVAVLQGLFSDTSADDDYFWVKIYRNGKIYQWGQMSDAGSVDGILTFITMTSRKDTDEEDESDVLFEGDEMTVTISGISKEMHDYLEALQNDSSGPAMFTGDRCLGYFLATSPVSQSVIFHPDEIPVYE